PRRARPGPARRGPARLRGPPRRGPGVRDVSPRLRRRDPARAGVRRDRRRRAGRGPGAAGAGDPGRAPAGVKHALAARHRRPGADMFRGGTSMTIALEIAAGMVLTTALVAGRTIPDALDLRRLGTLDDEQRGVGAAPGDPR